MRKSPVGRTKPSVSARKHWERGRRGDQVRNTQGTNGERWGWDHCTREIIMWVWLHNKMTLYYRVQSDRSSNCRASTKAWGEPRPARIACRHTWEVWFCFLDKGPSGPLTTAHFWSCVLILPGPAEGCKLAAEQEDGWENFTFRVLHRFAQKWENSLWLALGLCYNWLWCWQLPFNLELNLYIHSEVKTSILYYNTIDIDRNYHCPFNDRMFNWNFPP